jgi:hypothetical protein
MITSVTPWSMLEQREHQRIDWGEVSHTLANGHAGERTGKPRLRAHASEKRAKTWVFCRVATPTENHLTRYGNHGIIMRRCVCCANARRASPICKLPILDW